MLTRILLVMFVGLFALRTAVPLSAQQTETRPDPAAAESAAGQESRASSRQPRPHGGLPEDVPGLQQAAIEAYEAGNHLRFVQATIKLRQERPYEPQYLIGMVVGTALLGRQTSAYGYMHRMQQQGLTFDFNSTEDTASIRGTEVYDYLHDLLIRAGDPAGKAEVAFRLPESRLYPEAIAWDPTRGRFLVGMLDSGAVLAVSASGQSEIILEPGGWWAVHGLAVDAGRNRLWIATAAVPSFAGLRREDLGKSALLGFALDSLELIERHAVPADGAPHVLGSAVVSPGGDVYVIDRAVPVLYRKAAAGELAPYLGNRELVGFRDMVMSADGQRLYVADAALGILVVDPGREVSAMLAGPDTLNLGGISGLMVDGSALLMVQNGIRPQRLVRLELDDSGMAVRDVRPIANALPEFNYPSFGTVHDGAAYYFASGNLPGANEGPVEPVVLKSPVEPDESYATPEQRKIREDTLDKKSGSSDGQDRP